MLQLDVQDQVARITMCNPPINALTRPWAERFFELLDELQARNDWRVLHLRSSEKIFCAGGDIKQYAGRLSRDDAGDLLAAEAAFYQQLFARIAALPQVTLCEIGGVAAGGGMELALAFDLRIAAQTTKLGCPECGLGLLAAGGGTQRLTKQLGPAMALRLLGMAELISGSEAYDIGLVQWAVPAAEIAEKSAAIARRLAGQPPEALLAAKACVRAAIDPGRDGFALELTYPPQLMRTPGTQSRIREFLERQK